MEIIELNKDEYKSFQLHFKYKTNNYYALEYKDMYFHFYKAPFPKTIEKSFDDTLFSDWLEAPIAFGAFENGVLMGIIEGSPENWNHRFRISNFLVFEPYRHKGVGQALFSHMIQSIDKGKYRMVILETQSCNTKAIDFYFSRGLTLIGFDLYAYSNRDIENNEIRLEMGLILK